MKTWDGNGTGAEGHRIGMERGQEQGHRMGNTTGTGNGLGTGTQGTVWAGTGM